MTKKTKSALFNQFPRIITPRNRA